jgi:tRNA A-37 threonylcarbamoyl transferase component Bud32
MQMALNIDDHHQLLSYLRETGRIAPDESPTFEALTGGVSNIVVLVHRERGKSWVIKQALPKLRTKADWFCDPSRSHREAAGIRWLARLAPAGTIPALVFEDEPHNLLAMEAVAQPHENWKTMLLRGDVVFEHIKQFARLLAAIHGACIERQEEVRQSFADRSFFESLRLEPYYLYAAEQVPAARQFLHELVDATRHRQRALVHGDYSPKNILVREQRLILLDHEVIHWGDPAFDIGFSMTHFLSKANHLPPHRAQFCLAAVRYWREYRLDAAKLLDDPEMQRMCVRHTLGCLLARVAGRSPLEYLDSGQQDRQRAVVLELMRAMPVGMSELIEQFCGRM